MFRILAGIPQVYLLCERRIQSLPTRHLLLQIRVEVPEREFVGVDEVDPFLGITLVGDGAGVFLPLRGNVRRDVSRNQIVCGEPETHLRGVGAEFVERQQFLTQAVDALVKLVPADRETVVVPDKKMRSKSTA